MWKSIDGAPWDRVVLLTGNSGYGKPHDRFIINGYRVPYWHNAQWNDVNGTLLSDSGWIPDGWMEVPEENNSSSPAYIDV